MVPLRQRPGRQDSDPEESIFRELDPVLTAAAVEGLNWQGLGAFTEELGAAPSGVDHIPERVR
ncbi:hypothetical protein GCM10011609_27380 [Lentzea pudingi]|uniref:Uncharacterized protein n=1 Tax=Lentzea pudingi TaxID=1789439 RepID=A0ABQ2HV32_9PSEU|nr:hypothetical protein [Lentzea pudingi]GGM89077.1 hypothetical protein GCM10011609_27380 [Lentzea pudingi]